MAIDKVDYLKKLKSLLAYHKVIGIHQYPRNEEIESFCGLQVPPHSHSASSAGSPIPPVIKNDAKVRMKQQDKNREVTLSDINIEVAGCRLCDLYKQRIYPVAGRGGDKVRILIVGDWLSGDADGHLPADRILGVEQDLMLSRMLAAIKLMAEEVFITNVIKCAVPASCHPAAAHVRCCMSFLNRQIANLAPEVICTMGMIAAKAVLGRSQSLSQLRGKFHTYETEDGPHIPVLATYHPTYLLQNPEMKKATWADLQLLAKKLQPAAWR